VVSEQSRLYDQLIEISRDYLGPAAERFIARQVTTHLHKDPLSLTKQDIVKLTDWIKLAFALLSSDNAIVDEYTGRLLMLAKAGASRA
jgi:hypothetical protein